MNRLNKFNEYHQCLPLASELDTQLSAWFLNQCDSDDILLLDGVILGSAVTIHCHLYQRHNLVKCSFCLEMRSLGKINSIDLQIITNI